MLRVLVVLASSVALTSCAFAQTRHPEATGAAPIRLAYGTAAEQYGELRLPPGRGPFPVTVLIHGGCFVARMGTAKMLSSLADSLRDVGIATWNVEYRRVDSPGGGWPETFRDAGRAADYIRTLAKRFPLDTTRVVAVGHSAGGFLALWLGARGGVPRDAVLSTADPIPLQAAVALGADGDMPPVAPVIESMCGVPVAAQLFGADSGTVQLRRAQANPADMPASPVRQVLIVGDRDEAETPALREGYLARAGAKGERIELVLVPGATHDDVANPTTAAWPAVRDRLRALLSATPPR